MSASASNRISSALIGILLFGGGVIGHKSTDFFSTHCTEDILRIGHVKNDDRHCIVHAEGESSGIHHIETLGESLGVGDGIIAHCIGITLGITVVNSIDLGCLEDALGSYFIGPQGGGGVSGKERVAGTGNKNDDVSML